jgi:predicted nuclease of predicted toxin-antitoxin system
MKSIAETAIPLVPPRREEWIFSGKPTVPRKYRDALSDTSWASVAVTTDFLDPEATDRGIAEFATANGFVLFVRDEDFFEVEERAGTGVLFLQELRNSSPKTVIETITSYVRSTPTIRKLWKVSPGIGCDEANMRSVPNELASRTRRDCERPRDGPARSLASLAARAGNRLVQILPRSRFCPSRSLGAASMGSEETRKRWFGGRDHEFRGWCCSGISLGWVVDIQSRFRGRPARLGLLGLGRLVGEPPDDRWARVDPLGDDVDVEALVELPGDRARPDAVWRPRGRALPGVLALGPFATLAASAVGAIGSQAGRRREVAPGAERREAGPALPGAKQRLAAVIVALVRPLRERVPMNDRRNLYRTAHNPKRLADDS